MALLEEIVDGRTDLVFDYLAAGHSPSAELMRWCAYYGDVSAMKYLLAQGASLGALAENLDLNGAAFHGHWRLVKFLLEQGADANRPLPDTGETPLHAALSKPGDNLVLKVLLAAGARPDVHTRPGVETGAFMRDCRTRGEAPLHRAAAFGDEEAIRLLLEAGAAIDAKDAHGDTPLGWASWYLRPVAILRRLLHGGHRIHPEHAGMAANLRGKPHLSR